MRRSSMPGLRGPSAGGERGLCEALAAEAAAEVGRLAAAVACGLAAVSLRRLQARLRAQRRRRRDPRRPPSPGPASSLTGLALSRLEPNRVYLVTAVLPTSRDGQDGCIRNTASCNNRRAVSWGAGRRDQIPQTFIGACTLPASLIRPSRHYCGFSVLADDIPEFHPDWCVPPGRM